MLTIGELQKALTQLLADNPGWESKPVKILTDKQHKGHSMAYPIESADISYSHRGYVFNVGEAVEGRFHL